MSWQNRGVDSLINGRCRRCLEIKIYFTERFLIKDLHMSEKSSTFATAKVVKQPSLNIQQTIKHKTYNANIRDTIS